VSEIRGEKVVFGRSDYQPLDAMPSTAREDAIVLAVPARRSLFAPIARLLLSAVLLSAIAVGSLFLALEGGYLDSTLTAQAENSLSIALGDQFEPKVGAVRLRFSQNWMLALEARDVVVTHRDSRLAALKADSIKAVLDPVALLAGRLVPARTEIGTAEADLRFLPPRPPFDWSTVRIDRLPAQLALLYPSLDKVVAALRKTRTESFSASRLSLLLPVPSQMGDRIALSDVDFNSPEANRYDLTMVVAHGKLKPKLSIGIQTDGARATGFQLAIDGLAAEPLMMKYSKITGERRYGLDLLLELALVSERDKSLVARVVAGSGVFYADGDAQPVHAGRGIFSYDFKAQKIELSDGLLDLGQTVLPLEGTVLDLDHRVKDKPHGFAFEVVGNDAVAGAEGSGEAPEHFNATASGYFLPATKELRLDRMGIATASGNFAGSLDVRFVKPSPAVNFAARSDSLSTAAVKQLWPFWFGKKARHWVLANVSGGTISNGAIDVSLAAGRIPEHPEPLVFRENELHISFDATEAGIRFHPDMPASSKTSGRFEMQDRAIRIAIAAGQVRLPSGKLLDARNGRFEIGDISRKPLMAALSISASGDAAAAAEFTGFKPINALSKLPFAPADVSGTVKAGIQARFGLEKDQNPPKPDWDVDLALSNVGFKQPLQGRKIANVDANLRVDAKSAVLKGKARIDGMVFDVGMTEPMEKTATIKRQWQIQGRLAQTDILKLSPTLAGYVAGSVGIDISSDDGALQKARLVLTNTDISVPIFGWRKGPGIAATAEFTLKKDDNEYKIGDLTLSGDGFGVRGDMVLDSKGVVSARFDRVKLSTSDNFALSLQRKSQGLAIAVSGEAIDLRPFLGQVKSPQTPAVEKTQASHTITASLDRAIGYNKETLSAIDLKMATTKGAVTALQFSAVTRSGQAVVISRDTAAGALEISSGDAGAAARFADVYSNMNGGLLNVSLKARKADSWRGSVDIRNFSLVNEARLKSIVSAKTGEDGRSLSEAVKADIDVSSQKFRRGFARLLIDGKLVRIDNGVVRGDQVGATFQGTVRDQNGNMDMTGTFMPAYGLNRLFSELPLIGTILGNGRDRGLLGITFKLVGPFDQPKLSINPLSMIAPGVFRNIFEFE